MKQFLDRGYVYVPMDRCALTLPGAEEGSLTRGVVLLEMDDVMEGGDEDHEAFFDGRCEQDHIRKTQGGEAVRRRSIVQRQAIVSG